MEKQISTKELRAKVTELLEGLKMSKNETQNDKKLAADFLLDLFLWIDEKEKG